MAKRTFYTVVLARAPTFDQEAQRLYGTIVFGEDGNNPFESNDIEVAKQFALALQSTFAGYKYEVATVTWEDGE